MSSKTRGGSSKGFSEEDLQAILATLPTSPKLAPPQEIFQLLQEWHSKYSGLKKIKEKNATENLNALEVQNALSHAEIALMDVKFKIRQVQNENVIDSRRIDEMERIVGGWSISRRGAFSQVGKTHAGPIDQWIAVIKDLKAVFEPAKDFNRKGSKKTVEQEGIRALARIYWRSTKRKPTVTKMFIGGERRGPYFKFATAVISRVWKGELPTSLIEKVGREVGTESDTFSA